MSPWQAASYKAQFNSIIREASREPMIVFSFAFDDGNISQVRDFYPVLKKNRFPATFYIVASEIDVPGKLSTGILQTLVRENNEIGSHGFTHRSLLRLRRNELRNELERSQDVLSRFGARSFAYPFGHFNESIAAEVARYYDSARAYSPAMIVNRAGSLQRYALKSFPIEGRFQPRIQPETSEFMLSRNLLQSDAWFIITIHGQTSINLSRISSAFSQTNLSWEQWCSYMRDIRSRMSCGRNGFFRHFDMFCSRLSDEKVTVTTVTQALQLFL
jgi:peptidoglycan/xylan/chitin deacetylase (PgdA/CDA1 family)